MPTYEYECEKCGYRFEQFQSIMEKPLKHCPMCRCKVKRLLGTGSGIIFKGNGFYQTDYRSHSYMESEKREKSTADLSEGSFGKDGKKVEKDQRSEERGKKEEKKISSSLK